MPARKRLPSIDAILGPGGRLSRALPAYEYRPQQAEVCHAVEEAFTKGQHCLVEAGTGVGKSLAYLIPAVRAAARGKTAVISTHTINLQTQLIEKDIPLVVELLPEVEVKAALMKGRANYLCKQDLDAAEADLFTATDPAFRELKAWARRTRTGDVAELSTSYPAWYEVACNPDTCRGQECRYYDRCFYFQMRWDAQDANLIVVNHALFLSDLALRRAEPDAGVLPDYDLVVLDEAHHLEEVATNVFGLELNSRSIARFADRVRRTRDLDIDLDRLAGIELSNEDLFEPFRAGKYEFFFHDVLDDEGETRAREAAERVCVSLGAVQSELVDRAKESEPPLSERLDGLARTAGRLREEVHTLMFGDDPDYIHWGAQSAPSRDGAEGTARARRQEPRTTLRYTPVAVGHLLEEVLWASGKSVVLTSATLANSGGFSYLRSRLSIPETGVIERVVGSPFDFRRQAMLYVPRGLPEPPRGSVAAYTQAVADEVERIVELTEGRAFLLFTSWRMMNEVYEILQDRLPYPVFRQGERPPGKLLAAFRDSGNGCLFGTQTFWEGVDVQGDALSCVVIDRLPFAVPDSPITRARTDAIMASGRDWFAEYSVPQAQIRLKQGFGRLIRTRTDRGIVCILDTRLLTRHYGPEFVAHLPPASRASVWGRVERFWCSPPVPDAPADGVAPGSQQETAAASTNCS